MEEELDLKWQDRTLKAFCHYCGSLCHADDLQLDKADELVCLECLDQVPEAYWYLTLMGPPRDCNSLWAIPGVSIRGYLMRKTLTIKLSIDIDKVRKKFPNPVPFPKRKEASMNMNLQDVINESFANPEKYGSGRYFDPDGSPVCPIAKLILLRPETTWEISNPHESLIRAAKMLGVPKQHVWAFTNLWDILGPEYSLATKEKAKKRLEKLGYHVPKIW